MSASDTIKPIELETSSLALQKPEDKKREEKRDVDPLLLAFLFIFQAVQICHDTEGIEAKGVKALALAQNNEVNQEAQLNFYQLNKSQINNKRHSSIHWTFNIKARTYVIKSVHVWYTPGQVAATTLENLNFKNQEISALRNEFGNKLTVMQQNSSIEETHVNSIMNEDQQDISQGAAILQMMVSLSNQISQI